MTETTEKPWSKYKESRYRANEKYRSRFVQTKVLLTHELRDRIEDHCNDRGISMAEFIRGCIEKGLVDES